MVVAWTAARSLCLFFFLPSCFLLPVSGGFCRAWLGLLAGFLFPGVPSADGLTGGALGLRLLMALVLVGVSRDKNSGLRG